MIHPDTRLCWISEAVGHGVRATRDIPRGCIVWTQDALDRVFEPSVVSAMAPPVRALVHRFAHRDARGRFIMCWDAGRNVNHSCAPNLRGVGPWFMVARREIAAGEEITCDYAECNLAAPLECACGSPQCRGRIGGDDLRRLGGDWDAEARALAALISELQQPLWPYLLDPREAKAFAEGREIPPSFREQSAPLGASPEVATRAQA